MKNQGKKYTVGLLLISFFLVGAMIGRVEWTKNASAQVAAENELGLLHGRIRSFFENLTETGKGPKKALEEILKNSPLGADEKLTGELADKMKDINSRYGACVSFEEVGTKSVGNDLIIIRYLYKCENYPVIWYFTFYRPRPKTADTVARNWTLIGLRYDSNLDIALRDTSF